MMPSSQDGAARSGSPEPALSPAELRRYSRHLIMPEVGLEGQRALKAARVLLVGAGGLGSPAAMYLAAAGIGTLGIVDGDVVDESNLQRQVIHGTEDLGREKTASAAESIRSINPYVEVIRHDTLLTSDNALEIIAGYDLVVDGSDNFPTRYLVNDACVLKKKPYVYGSVYRFEGQVTVFAHEDGPCYRCLFPEPPPPGTVPSCAEGGVLGVLPGTIGLLQSTEAVKLVLGRGAPLVGRLLMHDALAMTFKEIAIRRDPGCPVCGNAPTVTELIDYHDFCGVPGHGDAEGSGDAGQDFEDEIVATELKAMLDRGERFVLVDVREPHEHAIYRIQGSVLIPLRDLMTRVNELSTADDIVVYCRVGARSAYACEVLRHIGFKRVRNLIGGTRAWAADVDPEMVRY